MKQLFGALLLPVVFCQQSYFIAKKTYADCSQTEFFDPATLTCVSCPSNSGTTSLHPNECKCNKGFTTSYSLDSSSILVLTCTACSGAVSLDGTACYTCGSGSTLDASSGRCVCDNSEEILDERNPDGSFKTTVTCGACTSAYTTNSESDQCISCPFELPLPNSNECSCSVANSVGDVCFAQAQSVNPETTITRNGQQLSSDLFTENLMTSYQKCLDGKDSTACNFLANLCVLQLTTTSGSACNLLLEVQTNRQPLTTIQGWREQFPWIILADSDYQTLTTYTGIEKSFDYQSALDITIATYSVNGTFLGFQKVTKGLLQLCKLYDNHLEKLWSFGAPVQQTCSITVENLPANTKFMDLYLEDNNKLYPLPVETSCDSTCGASVNPALQFTRRIFTADTVSNAEYTRVLKSLTISTEIKEDGTIFPPQISAVYGDVNNADGAAADISFEIKYIKAAETEEEKWKIVLGVLVGVFFFISLIPFISWNRRNGTMMLDGTMIIKFLLSILDGLAWAMFVTSVSFAVYTFFANNSVDPGQLPEDQSTLFITVTVLAFVFKTINVIHIVLDQSYADVFFIDWERERPLAEGDQSMKKTTASKISIWRTILAANEWSEIQTTRKTSITLQLFVVIFVLEVLNFDNYGCTTPNQSPAFKFNCENDALRQDSLYLRAGLAMIVYGSTALAQYIVNRLIISMFFNPILNFIDLLSVMNVSLFTLTHRQFGYYVHGKSVHGRADTDMLDLQNCLRREANGQTGTRGLEPGQDITTFEIKVTNEFRQYYDTFYRAAMVGNSMGAANEDEQNKSQVESYRRLNTFLQKFFMHGLPSLKLQFNSKGLWEKFLDIEFSNQPQPVISDMYRDQRGETIGNALFYGNESHLVVFEILSFVVFDIAFTSFILAAVITYILSRIIRFLRQNLARRNLSSRTMIDKRFLV
ncbi:Oidioi.mRNA.OKI2018_I69.PAR.g11322.t1.cds [Oikopleura dioica]|uniref:Oidioi.mRNA.OKI2018_I69.PAR.g11322.t1.cds n=1 Tax=Oikopleura dioica TaxID=34765 RepID=A0ABN7RY88_OIKDI|nr:Oidioi.mRNA.OKI2018_I69.PAR.g11322.t1.cds [Oikopleura dioica]